MSFPETKTLIAEHIYINEILRPEFLTIKGNHLIVSSSQTDPTLYVYSLPSLTFLNAGVHKGRGPHEIATFPMFCESPGAEMLYVWGYSPTSIGKNEIGMDGSLSFKEIIEIDIPETFNNMSIINDSLFIYYLPDNLTIKKYNLKTQEQIDLISLKKDDHKESYFYSNRGHVASNATHLTYSYAFKKQIDIYDINSFKLTKIIKWSDLEQALTPGDFGALTYHYRSVYMGEKYFYALYGGNEEKDPKDLRLEVYDYDGSPVREYMLDTKIRMFVVDETNSVLYGFSSQIDDYFIKYNL